MAINKEAQARIDDLAVRIQTWRSMQNYFSKLEREKKFSEANQVLADIEKYLQPKKMWQEVDWFWKNLRTEKGRRVTQQEMLNVLYAHRPRKSELGLVVLSASVIIAGVSFILAAGAVTALIVFSWSAGAALKILADKWPAAFVAAAGAGVTGLAITAVIIYGIYKSIKDRKKKATA